MSGPAPVCLIAEPIHPAGVEYLRRHRIEVRFASDSALENVRDELLDVDAIIVRNTLPAAAIDAAPRLRIIANHGTGTDSVDVAHASSKGIAVSYTPNTNSESGAEHALMLMLATSRQVARADAATRRAEHGFRNGNPVQSLRGKTLGVAGFGKTGRLVAQLGAGIGMDVVVWSPRSAPDAIARDGLRVAPTLAALLAQADVLSLHRPLRPDTARMIDRAALALMKPTAIIVNTSRGGLIDEHALADAIRESRIFGAGLDVLADEPMRPGSPLAGLERIVFTPHIAGSTEEALYQTALQCAIDVVDALAGIEPQDLVNRQVWHAARVISVALAAGKAG